MVNVIVASDPRYSINRTAIRTAIIGVLDKHHVRGKVEVEVSVVGDRKMHELNKKYRGLDSTTNILSFALEDPKSQVQDESSLGLSYPQAGFVAAPDGWLRLGSIVISYAQAVEDASSYGTSVEDEMVFLVEHGTTHLLGIHHPE